VSPDDRTGDGRSGWLIQSQVPDRLEGHQCAVPAGGGFHPRRRPRSRHLSGGGFLFGEFQEAGSALRPQSRVQQPQLQPPVDAAGEISGKLRRQDVE
jgi:hypothetical protein